MKNIRSRDNPFVKQLVALAHSARERKKAGLTVLDGIHLVTAYLDAVGAPRALAIAESALARDEVRRLLSAVDDKIVSMLPDAVFRELSSLDSPSFAVALVATTAATPTPRDSTVLVLEDVQDPGNVGSLLRSAAAAGVTEVLTSKTTAFCWSPKVLRAAQGAHFSLNIVEGSAATFGKEVNYRRRMPLLPSLRSNWAIFGDCDGVFFSALVRRSPALR